MALLNIEANRLFARGLDLFDGPPVLDIKPYRNDYRAEKHGLAEWYRKIREKVREDDWRALIGGTDSPLGAPS